jgi:AAA family ATP:ADP antiporter
VFTEVRRGEGGTALLLMLNVFLLLTCYYILKPVREALILTVENGAELKSYMSAGQSLLLLAVVPAYGWLTNRMDRRRLINSVTFFFTACLVVFYLLAQANVPLGIVFFLWVGIFNLMVIAQFWSFANDVYTEEQGKRLFVIVSFGASLGAVLGSRIAGLIIEPLGLNQMFLVAGAILVVSLLITNVVDSRERARGAARAAARAAAGQEKEVEEAMSDTNPFKLVLQQRYLLLIAFLILLLNWVNTTGGYILDSTVKNAADQAALTAGAGFDSGEYIGKFYADFFSVVNLVSVLIQLFLVSRILKYIGVRWAMMFLPVIALGAYAILAFYPVLSVVRWAKTAENATDYSLQNTLRGVLFLPTTREEKYKAKQAIDTFFVRAGDVLSALLVYVGTTFLAFKTKEFAIFNLALVVIWLFIAVAIGRRYQRMAAKPAE